MTFEMGYVLAILILVVILFLGEWFSLDLVGLFILAALFFGGILEIDEALAGFGNRAVIAVGALFIVSEGLLKTGAVGVVSNRLYQWSKGNPLRLLVFSFIVIAVASAFLNNTPIVAMFIPVMIGLAHHIGVAPSKFLIPISYAAILGGTCTIIGTSTNILVSSLAAEFGYRELGMFEFTKLGIIYGLVGFFYILLFGWRLLPDRETITSLALGKGQTEYVTEILVQPHGPVTGKKVVEILRDPLQKITLLQIVRGEEVIWPPLDEVILQPEDVLVIGGNVNDLIDVQKCEGLEILPEILSGEAKLKVSEATLAEVLIHTFSPLVGSTLEEVEFRKTYGLNVLAIERRGLHVRTQLTARKLRPGDVLLVQGDIQLIDRLRGRREFILMEGIEDVVVRKGRAPIAVGILAAIVILASLRLFPLSILALAGALLMVACGCLSAQLAYRAVNWQILILIAGTISLGLAMEKTGLAELIAEVLVSKISFLGPAAIIAALYLLTTILTACISNNATAVLLTPIVINLANNLGVSPLPFLITVAFGASASFATPIGYQTNTMVYGAAGYRFFDFLKIGLPLNLIMWLVASLLIPALWL